MSDTVTQLQQLITDHPGIALDLNDVLFAMECDQKLTRHEIEAIQEHAMRALASFRAEAAEAAQNDAQRVSDSDQNAWQNEGSVPVQGSGHERAEVRPTRSADGRRLRLYGRAISLLASYDANAAATVRMYVATLRNEAAAARIEAREAGGTVAP